MALKKTLTGLGAFILMSAIVIGAAYSQTPPPNPFDIPLTVERSADRLSATATWTPNQGADIQAFFVVAKLFAGEPDSTGYGIKADTFRYVDWPLAGDVGSLVITGLDPGREHLYGVTSGAGDADGNLVWSAWEIAGETISATPTPTPTPTATLTPTATPTPQATPIAVGTPTIAELVRNVEDGVAQIITLTSGGSGFIIDSEGRVVTNQHVVGGNRSVTVRLSDGSEYRAAVLGVDPVADLAVVDMDGGENLRALTLGDSDTAQIGEEVVAIGYPLGFQLGQSQTVTKGIISARRTFGGGGVEHFQTDAALNPGNSGGPLFNRAGEVIGVNTSGIERTPDGRPVIGISFAVSINEVKARLDDLKGGVGVEPSGSPTPVPTPVTSGSPVPTPEAAPTPPALPTGWSRYNNGYYGFSIDMPPGWVVDEEDEELNYAYFGPLDRQAGGWVNAYDLPSSYSLQEFALWYRDWLRDYARDESWDLFEVSSFDIKREGGQEFYEMVWRAQPSTEFCIERNTERIYMSLWYPGKPHGFRVGAGVCEHSLNRYPVEAIHDSFTEWMPYWNAAHAFGLNVAPGWTLEENKETDDYAEFWTADNAGVFQIFVHEVGPSGTLEDFVNWRLDILNRLGDSWEVFELTGTFGSVGVVGARDQYLITYVSQLDSEYCVSADVELLALSSYHPTHPYGFLVVTGVCQGSLDLYDDQRWEMMVGFRN